MEGGGVDEGTDDSVDGGCEGLVGGADIAEGAEAVGGVVVAEDTTGAPIGDCLGCREEAVAEEAVAEEAGSEAGGGGGGGDDFLMSRSEPSDTCDISENALDFSDRASLAIKIRISMECGPRESEASQSLDITSLAFTSPLKIGVLVFASNELLVALANFLRVSLSLEGCGPFSISASFLAYAVCLTQYNLNIGA